MTTSKGRVVAVAIVALLGATPGWAQEGGQRADLADSLAQLAAILEGAGEQETPEEETSYGRSDSTPRVGGGRDGEGRGRGLGRLHDGCPALRHLGVGLQ